MCDGMTRCDGEEDEAGCGKQRGREGVREGEREREERWNGGKKGMREVGEG